MDISHSRACFAEARKVIPGGVNSPVRSFRGVKGHPLFMSRGQGALLWDVDGNEYVDCIGSWGPMILGHAHPDVVQAVQEQLGRALSIGAPTEQETEIAQLICSSVPSVDQVRMVNSGTEAAMSAIRLARGYTGRNKILKFEGCYHGHVDSLLVKAGSGALTMGVPDSAGVPAGLVQDTLTAAYNNTEQTQEVFEGFGNQIAAVIVEPIAGNMNCVLPAPGFLETLRTLCDKHGSLLIFDEVMTGFRVHPGGAQGLYGQTPDISIFGKIIGGGLPVGAFGGRRDIMAHLAPEGPVYQAGTLSGNPIAVAAGLATLRCLQQQQGVYESLSKMTTYLVAGLREAAEHHNLALATNQVCGMFGIFFTEAAEVTSYKAVMASRTEQFNAFFHYMLNEGVYLAPSAFEAGFLSTAHDQGIIDRIIKAADRAFGKLAKETKS